jgi:propanol-preferring alcohol dehydrogenase
VKAQVLSRQAPIATRPLTLVDAPDPVPEPRDVVVRVTACGVCRTDLHVIEGDLAPHRLPLVPGHQVVGRVESVGSDASRFALGDRVGIAWLRATCGGCAFCRSGRENLCESSRYTGWDADGGYAERAAVDEAFAYAIPDEIEDVAAAPLLCAGIIGYRALARSRIAPGARLGLYGFGSSAHLVAQLARHRGCDVYVATRNAAHRRLAEELGAVWTGGTHDTPPAPLDAAIVFAPVGEAVPPALAALGAGGTVAVAGIHMSDIPSMPYGACLFREKSLTSVTSNTRDDGEALLEEACAARLAPRVTTFALSEANDALAAVAGDRVAGTAVLIP